MIFDSMISGGTTGMTSRCSTVPCSRSRMSAAPVRITVSMVMLLTTCMTEENQLEYRFGLNLARITTLTGCAHRTFAAGLELGHLLRDDVLDVDGAVAGLRHRRGVDV